METTTEETEAPEAPEATGGSVFETAAVRGSMTFRSWAGLATCVTPEVATCYKLRDPSSGEGRYSAGGQTFELWPARPMAMMGSRRL